MKTIKLAIFVLLAIVVAGTAAAESPDEIHTFASQLKKDGMFEAAAAQFLRFARENPTDARAPEALLSAGECLVESGDISNAVTVLETIAETYPDHSSRCRVKVQLGRLYFELDRFEEADRVFTDVIVAMPDCDLVPDALLGKGETLISTEDYQGAFDVLTSLIDNYIESTAAPRASYNRAYCLERLDRDDEALRAYERIVVRFPTDPIAGFAALEAARFHSARGNAERAIQFYARAKQFESKVFFVPASVEGAELLQSTGEHRQALAWLEELLALPDLDDPRSVHIRAVRAAFNAKDYDSVQRLSANYATRYPKTFSPQITYIGAQADIERGDYDHAIGEANRLEEFAPGTEWGRSGARIRGQALLGMGRSHEGVSELGRFVTIAADSAARCDVLRSIADVSFTVTRDTTRALQALTELLAVQRRQYPSELLDVGIAHERVGRNHEASSLYDDLMDRFPLSNEADQAQSRREFLEEFTVTDYASAARELDRLLYEAMRNPAAAGGLLRVAQARIDVMKDFRGALEVCGQLERTARGTEAYPRLLYLRGLCHAKIARKAAHDGDEKTSEESMKAALEPWQELEKNHAATPWAARAAFERVVLRASVDGIVDSKEAAAVLARYPNDSAGARLLEQLGDHFSSLDGNENVARAANYYAQALNAGETSSTLWLKSGIARAGLGKHDEAVKTFERLSKSETRVGLRAAYEAGRSLRALKRYRDAIAYFDRVSARDPRGSFGASAALQAADCQYLDKDYEGALKRYEAAARIATTEARRWEVSHRTGLCLKQMGRRAEALTRLLECVTSKEGGALRARAYQDAAEVAESLGDYSTQRNILEAFVAEVATGAEVDAASRKLVRVYLASGQPDQAHALASRLDQQSDGKDDVEPRALLAMALYRQGKNSDAKKREDDVVKVVGPDAPIVREIGVEAARYHYDQKSYKAATEAIRPYAQSCTGDGVCEQARYLLAMSLFADKQLQEGSSVAQAFFRDFPVSGHGPMLHLRMGNVLATAGRRSESLLHYEDAAETAQDTTIAQMALKNLGTSYQQLKRWRDAEGVWERVLERFPSSEAAMNRAQCRMEQGKYEGAIAAYEEAMPILDSESKAWAFYWVGQSYEQLGNTQAAVVEYLKVPYLAKSGGMLIVTSQLKAAECYAKISRPAAARDLYTKVLGAHGANSNWGKLAQKGLDQLDNKAQTSNPGGDD